MTPWIPFQKVLLVGLLCHCGGVELYASELPAEVVPLDEDDKTKNKIPTPPTPPTTDLDVNELGFKATVTYRTESAPKTGSSDKVTDPSNYANRVWGLAEEEGVAMVSDTHEAIEDLSGTEPPSPLLEKAMSRSKNKKPKDAALIFQDVVLAEPDNAEAYYHLGVTLVKAGDVTHGATILEKAVVLKPKNLRYQNTFGQAALQAGSLEKALVACQTAALSAPKEARYQSAFGDCLLQAGRFPEAVSAYSRAIAIDKGQNPAYIYNLGLVHLHVREFKKAIEIFDQAISTRKDYAPYFCSRGLAHENLKNIKQAREDYANAICIDKNDAYAHFLLAGLYSNPDDPTFTNRFEAVAHAEKACKLSEFKNARYLMGLARALRVAYNYEQAVFFARKAIQIDPREDYKQELEKYQVQLKQEGAVLNDGKK